LSWDPGSGIMVWVWDWDLAFRVVECYSRFQIEKSGFRV
jgi:hypothetical protein